MDELAQGVAANVVSLLFGHPDPTTLMTPEFQEAVQTLLVQPQGYRVLQYGPEQGIPMLMNFLVDRLNQQQGLSITEQNVMITAGSTGAMDMVARLYARRGVVIVEAPSYTDTLHVFRDHDIDLRSVPMDENGLIVTELEKVLEALQSEGKAANFLYTIPNFHNPTGITASLERRQAVIKLAEQYGFMIVEDDVYHDLGFGEAVPPSYYALMGGKNVISVGSLSKTLAPGLRVGWLVAAPEMVENCVNCGVMQMGGGSSPFSAHIAASYCCSGHWDTHMTRLQDIYRKRCETMLAALEREMPEGVRWTHPAGGFFLWIYLPENVFARDVKRVGLERGVSLAGGNGFFVRPEDGDHNLRLAFSYASLEDIDKGVHILADVIRDLMSKR